MARHVNLFPRRKRAEKLLQDRLIACVERGDLGRHVEWLRRGGFTQLGNAAFELDETLLAFDDHVVAHPTRTSREAYSRRRMSVSLSLRRSTTMSIAPFSKRNSAV